MIDVVVIQLVAECSNEEVSQGGDSIEHAIGDLDDVLDPIEREESFHAFVTSRAVNVAATVPADLNTNDRD